MDRLRTFPLRWTWVRETGPVETRPPVAGTAVGVARLPVIASLLAIAFGVALAVEARTSWLEARLLAAATARIAHAVEAGRSPAMPQAPAGPFDVQRGYARLPEMVARLERHGYEVVAQARSTPFALLVTRAGAFPIYAERAQAGLTITDRDGRPLFSARDPARVYADFDEIPSIIVRSVLFIENRELALSEPSSRNPAIEWDRLLRAVADLGWSFVDPRHAVSGGSTLATQLEKIRHSPEGRTGSVREKARQILTASLRAYRDGLDTLAARRRIVCDYLNALPLGARPEHGEVHGLLDGLAVWYGADPDHVNGLLRGLDRPDRRSGEPTFEEARAFRQVLSLLLASRRPGEYLTDWAALDARTDAYLRRLAAAGVISSRLRDRALGVRVRPSPVVVRPRVPFAARKASDAVRASLGPLLGDANVYALDRFDLEVATTLDGAVNAGVTAALQRFTTPAGAAAAGLVGERLLGTADPSRVVYSVTVYERGDGVNTLRVQADTLDQPLNVNASTKLELGSTAKLRTLITYLELVAELHDRYARMSPGRLALERASLAREDAIRRWAIDYLQQAAGRGQSPSLEAMLDAALDRTYSASPAETFFTGGGVHTFANFDPDDDARVMSVREAFHRSVNLVFVRLMRDIVRAHVFRDGRAVSEMLADAAHPGRRRYLERFADEEGRVFLRRFYAQYRGLAAHEAFAALLAHRRPTADRLAAAFRSVRPDAPPEALAAFLAARLPSGVSLRSDQVARLYERYDPARMSLHDRAYVAGVHPLELWLVAYLRDHPRATLDEVVRASAGVRQEAYRWLFTTRHKAAQDLRIRTVLEAEAFDEIHRGWVRLGYPFDRLVPSYATAIGSSGDNPAALADLVGIILNDGVRQPTERIRRLRFAAGTPYETVMVSRRRAPERVLRPEIARVVRRELVEVVERGTAVRARGAWVTADGTVVPIGGKTGTGDNRVDLRGGRSRPLNRTAAFVFFVGDRLFGTVVAYVPGEAAADYRFTSALPVQVFTALVPVVRPLVERAAPAESDAILGDPARRVIDPARERPL